MMATLKDSADVVIDNVGGDRLSRHGRCAEAWRSLRDKWRDQWTYRNLDMRTMYLRDFTLIGCTAWDEPVFPNLVGVY